LAAAAPRGEARLRFPLLNQVLWLLDLPIPAEHTSIDKLAKSAVKSRRLQLNPQRGEGWPSFFANVRAYAEGPLPAWAAVAGTVGVINGTQFGIWVAVLAVVAGLLFGSLHVLWLSRSWAGHRRYQWFRRQPYVWREQRHSRSRRFVEFAERVLKMRQDAECRLPQVGSGGAASRRQYSEQDEARHAIECLLVNAFLEDLRQGYERRVWKIWRRVTWTRTTYPVLLIDGGDTSLVRRIEEVRTETATPDPLLVIAMIPPHGTPLVEVNEPPSISAVRPEGAEDVWEDWKRHLARDRSVGSWRILRIEIDPDDATLFEKFAVRPPAQRPRPLLASQLVPVVTLAALVAAPLAYVGVTTNGTCAAGIRRVATGECIGISDSSFSFNSRLDSVMEEIQDNNYTIAQSRRPAVTVIYLGALSVPNAGADDLLADVQGELAGIAIAQRRLIKNNKDGTRLQMRILVANAGTEFTFADELAAAIVDRVDHDPTIVGAIGFAESRSGVKKAIERLSQRALPMISTAATFDALGRTGDSYAPSFFPLAPPNSELAKQAAYWARRGFPEVHMRGATTAAVFTDTTASDLYSRDLGERFLKEFGNDATQIAYSGAASLQPKVSTVCTAAKQPDLIYFAGRSSQFGTFIDMMTSSQCHDITIMAGDAVAEYVNDRAEDLARNQRIRLVYTPLASPNGWQTVPKEYRTDFYGQLNDLVQQLGMAGSPVSRQPSAIYATLADDAATALMNAAQAAYLAQHVASDARWSGKLDRGGILLALEELPAFDGASGLVKLHGAADQHHALDRPVLLVAVNEKGEQIVVAQCGRLYLKQPPASTVCSPA
jgi:hypothetical protein